MKRLLSLGLILSLCSISARAQQAASSAFGYYAEALLFSRTNPGGSARIQGIGGAQTALGGDISHANSNPAGLGFFNKSIATFTPSLTIMQSDTEFRGQSTNTFKNNFNINNMGVVFSSTGRDAEAGKFRGSSFALSLQRINNFHNEYHYEAYSDDNSIIDSFIQTAEDTDPENLTGYEKLAYDHFLMDLADYNLPDTKPYYIEENGVIRPNPGDGTLEGYGSPFGMESNPRSLPRQHGHVRTQGAQYQWNVSYGANYDDLFYLGGGIGVQSIQYTRKRTYIEDQAAFDDGEADDLLNAMRIDDRLRITGIGINASIGIILRPLDFFRLGASYTTPTFSTLNEESEFTFATDWNPAYSYDAGDGVIQLGEISDQSDITASNYRLRSPGSLTLGGAFFLGKSGFLAGDVEFVDYTDAQLKSSDFSTTADNRSINQLYQSAINYRLGAELRIDIFRFRAGYSHQGDAFSSADLSNGQKRISGGIGIRLSKYYADLAMVNTKSDNSYAPYNLVDKGQSINPAANVETRSTTISITMGFNF